jgi:PP-loop superfamily ATP-utilizing enzyme
MLVAAFSGGKDSTEMALGMADAGERPALLFTPAGDEPPELFAHVARVVARTGLELVRPPAPTLARLIDDFAALPNRRQRWCTRLIKIQPCIAFLAAHPGSTLCVGLRADEPLRQGIYGDHAAYRYPLRERGMAEADVWRSLAARGVDVPRRTNCKTCYAQRLGEWWRLWKDDPAAWAAAEALEARTGHTFRAPSRDTWPAALCDLRAAFAAGRVPKKADQLSLFDGGAGGPCRVCTL